MLIHCLVFFLLKDLRHLICSEVDPLPAALDSYGKMFAQRVKNHDDVAITQVWVTFMSR